MTDAFTYRDGELYVDEIPVRELAEIYGTPCYIYSQTHFESQYRALAGALSEHDPLLFFAMKSNSNAAVIRTFANLGAGADVVSGGELVRARRAGVPADRIVFAGVGKTVEEIDLALDAEILYFTVESEPELERLSERAVALEKTARIAIRVNPDVDPKTHKYTSTGKRENKFGVDLDRARRAYERAAGLPGIEIAGIHMHLGSPLMSTDPYVEALEKMAPVCRELKAAYESFRHLDIGGGLGIAYKPEDQAPTPDAFARAVGPHLRELGLSVGLEPGRFLTGNGGILVTRVEYVKENPFKKFTIVDAAMNDLLRPALYEAHHEIQPVRDTGGKVFGDIVGPVCESGDFMANNRDLPAAGQGDLLAVMSAGAYGFVMASNYNSRPFPPEILVHGDRHAGVRKRQTLDDLFADESIPDWL